MLSQKQNKEATDKGPKKAPLNTIISNTQFIVAKLKMNEVPFFVRNFRNKEKIRGKLNYLANTLVGTTTRSATKNNDKLKKRFLPNCCWHIFQ